MPKSYIAEYRGWGGECLIIKANTLSGAIAKLEEWFESIKINYDYWTKKNRKGARWQDFWMKPYELKFEQNIAKTSHLGD